MHRWRSKQEKHERSDIEEWSGVYLAMFGEKKSQKKRSPTKKKDVDSEIWAKSEAIDDQTIAVTVQDTLLISPNKVVLSLDTQKLPIYKISLVIFIIFVKSYL